jgi:acetyl-CoA carboxylase biotin carboxylase subunit
LFKKILIANRGEIALRVIHACRELGVATVAVHSTADRDSLHVTYADEDVCIGPPSPAQSYLDVTAILSAAEITGADAVHPGYGFLSENAHFAEILAECNLAWIGPRPDTIRRMGDKAVARQTATAAGVPVLPGSEGALEDASDARAVAARVGYPIILKAAAGGGGRGMRVVNDPDAIQGQFDTARTEAERAFGDGSLYLEKYLVEPRHVEFQRRHQKLIEEAPAPGLTDELREAMGEAAVRLARAVDYENAGTVEFLLDSDGSFYFMEMNTRIQVEHPVTETVLGLDLVKTQIRVAAGEPLDVPAGLKPRGHAIECRINAEDPKTFAPSPGHLETFHVPGGPGVRVDTHGYEDYFFPPYYDSLIAKLIASGGSRDEAIVRMQRALDSFVIEGIKTSLPLHRLIMRDPEFRAGRLSTRFMEGFTERTTW